jgi:hypothetical protein
MARHHTFVNRLLERAKSGEIKRLRLFEPPGPACQSGKMAAAVCGAIARPLTNRIVEVARSIFLKTLYMGFS